MALGSTPSAKWTDELHKLFVELCANEVVKGNRVGTYLNKEGWGVIDREFVRQKNVRFTTKQFKNHWESMKQDYKLFSQLKFGESGLGWNEITKKIKAEDSWWIQKAEANPKINKFRNKDLSLFMNYYQTLFGDIVATGTMAKAATTYSAVDLEVGQEFTETLEDDGKERSGDSDENNSGGSKEMFPPSSLKSGKSSGTKRKKSGVEHLRDCLDGLGKKFLDAMSSRSIQSTAAQMQAATEDASFNARTFAILHVHSSCRMVIKRTFGVWKARFAILTNMPMYKIDTQTDIILATMAIHNYIRKSNASDSAFQTAESETYIPRTSTSRTSNRDEEAEREDDTDNLWIATRDFIAAHIT